MRQRLFMVLIVLGWSSLVVPLTVVSTPHTTTTPVPPALWKVC
ncbi:hypothetical protein AB0B50_34260 [Streptomyces sp. NPDC041068]